MLTESKIRQVGFIRNNSSRKIIYNQKENQQNKSSSQSNDSFSSFEYDSRQFKGNINNIHKNRNENKNEKGKGKEKGSQLKSTQKYQQLHKSSTISPSLNKPLTLTHPQIPKPPSKRPIGQPSFQNQKLKNNFFQQHQNNQNNLNKHLKLDNDIMRQDIQKVKNICEQIGGLRLEGNFSFNPKTNKVKVNEMREKKYEYDDIGDEEEENVNLGSRTRTKQNNYFKEKGKFQYESDEQEDDDQHKNGQPSSSSQQQDYQDQDYFENKQQQQQQQQKFIQKSKRSNHHRPQSGKIIQKKHHVISLHKDNEGEELIMEYDKREFSKGKNMPGVAMAKNQPNSNKYSRRHNVHNEQEQLEGVFQKSGGLCFDVDVKQFSHNVQSQPSVSTYYKKPSAMRKKNPQSEKQEILKRRMQAKIYSKQARFRLFGFA